MVESPQAFLATVLVLAGFVPALAAWSRSRLFAVLPPVVLSYALATALAVTGLWARSPGIAEARGRLLDLLLPALVFLMLVRCDLRAVARVGPPLLLAFAVAATSILAGCGLAWTVWRPWLPPDGWQVMAAVAAGWIGGTANLVAVAGGIEASADNVGLAVVTDTVCYSCWALLLFSAAAFAGPFDRWSGGRPITQAGSELEPEPTAARRPSPIALIAWLGIALLVGRAAAAASGWIPAGGPVAPASWTLLLATAAGAGVAQTPLSRLPGSETLAAALLAVVVVAMASQATFAGFVSAPLFVAAGFTVLACHALAMALAARVLRLDLAACSVASLANIGGVASAPLLAALHAPSLAPVAVFLALLGYLIGMPAGLGLAAVLPRLGLGLAPPTVLLLVVAASACRAGEPDRRSVDHWLTRCPEADRVLLDAAGVAAANARMVAADPSVRDLAALPPTLPRAEVADWIATASRPPAGPLVCVTGVAVTAADRERWQASLALDHLPAEVAPRFGLVARRADVRRVPSADRVLADAADRDIDRFQETALFPGTPVAVLHHSADAAWCFAVAPTYAGWVASDAVAHGPRDAVLAYAAGATRFVTGSRVRTAFTPEVPAVSQLLLDMGVALPVITDWPQHEPVNGQLPWAGHVVRLPGRGADGSLTLLPALVPGAADTHAGPLPATRGNVIRQACKFLGDRYGWGHDYESRDCSGLVSDVYRSLGLVLPRNTADQARSPGLDRTPLPPSLSRAERLARVASLAPGDLIYAPRHVMILLGHDPEPWIIHATHGGGSDSPVNGIVIVPLADVAADGGGPIIDAATTLVRVLPAPGSDAKRP